MNRPPQNNSAVALLALGFRPLYLLAGAFATLGMLLWTAQISGLTPAWLSLRAPQWHAQEMLFGYTFAVIAGFLFTAVRNWTQLPTPTGGRLAAVCLLWVIGRVLVFTPWYAGAALTDTLFTISVALGIAVPLVRSRNRRNYFFVFLVLALGAANLACYGAIFGSLAISGNTFLTIALDLVLFIMAVVAGRVVPMFTNNAVPGAGARRVSGLEYVALGAILLLLAADLAGSARVATLIAIVAAIAHAARLGLWSPFRTWRNPLLWILHVSYAWIVLHLALRGAAGLGWIPPSFATHALTVGAVGGLTLGMMTRSARGHTGRALEAERSELACFTLIELAAVTRVLVPLLIPAAYLSATIAGGLLWSLAFGVFTVAYWPVLTRPRIDGKPG
jgi:uncharacterized protein involved in response to NO